MKKETREAFEQVALAMYKSTRYRIGGLKRRKNLTGEYREILMDKELSFRANSYWLLLQLRDEDRQTRTYPTAFLRKDQHTPDIFRRNLKDILGENHPEIDNIINFVFK